jgi:glutamate formiminotransferase / 5-formyltetrahydrofolate cyclo-ligase
VPNVSEGRDDATIAAVAEAFGSRARLLDVHRDPDHDRSVYTLAGAPEALLASLVQGAAQAVARIDLSVPGADRASIAAGGGPAGAAESAATRARTGGKLPGVHPFVGALDVAPIVYLDERSRGAACAVALVLADRLAEELSLPVFLYGELTGSDSVAATTRAQLRTGGLAGLARRMSLGELRPDFGPSRPHLHAGATLVAARPPLVAFNLTLAPPATVADARRIAALIREGGPEGLPGLRAIGVPLARSAARDEAPRQDGTALRAASVPQIAMNVERPFELSLARIVQVVGRHAAVAGAELVGLAPAAAFAGFPEDLLPAGFDPRRHLLEHALE